jgi:hypothetical protein
MADRKALSMIGFALGGITAAVTLMAATVVLAQIDGSLALETIDTAGVVMAVPRS